MRLATNRDPVTPDNDESDEGVVEGERDSVTVTPVFMGHICMCEGEGDGLRNESEIDDGSAVIDEEGMQEQLLTLNL